MAIHYSIQSMLQESLVEIFLVARYCINFRKDPKIWGSSGCYGYPAAILLFVIADSIGSYVIGKDTRKHFEILDHREYYNLGLGKDKIDKIYKKYRCLLTHNAVMATDIVLNIGKDTMPVYQFKEGKHYINLVPFLKITQNALLKFLENCEEIVYSSEKLREILNT